MSITNEITRISAAKADLKRAINAKGGTLVNEKIGAYAEAVDAILPEEFRNRVRFIDYDGTVLKTMYVADGESASPPEIPIHNGLVFQSWNVSLDNVMSNRDIGAIYTTQSGAAEFLVKMVVRTGYTVTFYPYIESGTLSIDWGDGSTDTVSAAGKQTVSYTYADYGDYTVKFSMSHGGSWYIADYFCNGSSGNAWLIEARIAGVYKVHRYAFQSNYGLKYVLLDNSVTALNEYAFYECRGLQAIIIPPSVTTMEQYTIHGCYGIRRVVVSDAAATIPEGFCYDNHSMDGITIPDGVTAVDDYAFYNCYSMTDVGLPQTLTSIGCESFRNCNALKAVHFPDGLTTIGDSAFRYCYGLTEIVLPDSITSLGSYIFQYCYAIRKINIPAQITQIPTGFCCYCHSLESITIPRTITYIGDEAFSNCFCLIEVDVPSTVTNIRGYVFNCCRSMRNMYFHATTPPTLGNSSCFSEIPGSCIIHVPASTDRTVLTAYKTASNWSNYAGFMYEMED